MENTNSENKPSYPGVCDKCKKDCTLPFKPTTGKPVLCKDCFSNNRPQRSQNNNNNNRARESHKAVCDKCKKDCTVPFKPTTGKPILCGDCFRNKN